MARQRLIDSLGSNLSVLNASIGALLASEQSRDAELAAAQHRSSLNAYVFFLHWVTSQAAQESREAGGGQACSYRRFRLRLSTVRILIAVPMPTVMASSRCLKGTHDRKVHACKALHRALHCLPHSMQIIPVTDLQSISVQVRAVGLQQAQAGVCGAAGRSRLGRT